MAVTCSCVGFDILLQQLDDLSLDTPNASEILGNFIARAIADDCLPPAYVQKPSAFDQIQCNVRKTSSILVIISEKHFNFFVLFFFLFFNLVKHLREPRYCLAFVTVTQNWRTSGELVAACSLLCSWWTRWLWMNGVIESKRVAPHTYRQTVICGKFFVLLQKNLRFIAVNLLIVYRVYDYYVACFSTCMNLILYWLFVANWLPLYLLASPTHMPFPSHTHLLFDSWTVSLTLTTHSLL